MLTLEATTKVYLTLLKLFWRKFIKRMVYNGRRYSGAISETGRRFAGYWLGPRCGTAMA